MKKQYKLPLYVFTILIFSRMFFYPLNIQTRFSMGIIALSIILLIEKKGYFQKLIPWCILLITLERLFSLTFFAHLDFYTALLKTFPIGVYYLAYYLVLRIFKFDSRTDLVKTFLLLFADVISNIVELTLRGELGIMEVKYLLVVSILRICVANLIYSTYKYKIMIISQEIHQKNYLSLNLLVSSLEAELFYLKKSKNDIEDVMKKAHSLYLKENLSPEDKDLALHIARDVHEIKKDYYRISKGIEHRLNNFNDKNSLSLNKLKDIILSNTNSYIKKSNKNINFYLNIKKDISICNYNAIFIIINNLIVNSVDAIGETGEILSTFDIQDNTLKIEIEDNGKGISPKNLKLLFNPGFTTKYDRESGEMNTGLGLSHVDNIVNSLGGKIDIYSVLNEKTIFYISVPISSLVKGEE